MSKTQVIKTNLRADTGNDHTYPILLRRKWEQPEKTKHGRWGDWIVDIHDTPGAWYYKTLAKDTPRSWRRLAIDMGQDWWWEDFSFVFPRISMLIELIDNFVVVDKYDARTIITNLVLE